jgi:non-ribosomal peptide synthetase component E (peptide arylation enzyme)
MHDSKRISSEPRTVTLPAQCYPWASSQSAAYVLAFLQLATVCTLQMDSEQRVWAPQMPQVLHFVEAIPRNAMGKVNKKALLKDVFMRD